MSMFSDNSWPAMGRMPRMEDEARDIYLVFPINHVGGTLGGTLIRSHPSSRSSNQSPQSLYRSPSVYWDAFCDCDKLEGPEVRCNCGEEETAFEWVWDNMTKSAATVLACNDREVCFHTKFSSGTAAVKGCQAMRNRQYYWEIKMTSPVYGTDMMIGVGTGDIDLNKSRYLFHSLLGSDCDSWALSYMGTVHHQGQSRHYSTRFGQGSIIGVHLDLWHGTLSFYSNRKPLGIAYRNLHGKTLFPMVSSTAARSKMKVVRSCSFDSSLQYLCCLKLRQAVPADRAVIDVVPLPPGLKNYLGNNLDWLLCTKNVPPPAPQQQPSRTLYSKRRLSDRVSDSDDEVVLAERQRKRANVL